jgi:AcrR family transcriptional regulator
VLAVATRQLCRLGYEAMSLSAVAAGAGTTRQALYRRWPTKKSLATAALCGFSDAGRRFAARHPLDELVAELEDFQRGVSRPGRLSLVGTMLQDGTAAELRARYRAEIVAPRRRRIRTILERARNQELIDPNADLDVAVTMCTGSWYARALAGLEPPAEWPARIAALVWRAVGGMAQ